MSEEGLCFREKVSQAKVLMHGHLASDADLLIMKGTHGT
jgi:hypothetical protein